MRKTYMVLLATILISASSFCQMGKSFIGVGADLSLPTGDFGNYMKTGTGGYVKGIFGVGTTGQVTLTTGYSSFKGAGDDEDFKSTESAIPLLIGYRHNFNRFFVEPQLGYGIYTYKENSFENGYYTETDGAFTWAAGVGYVFNNKIEVSGRYQGGGKEGWNVQMFGLRLGYNFSLNTSK